VLGLANRLRAEGVDCALDRYESFPPEGWPKWMARQTREAEFVLIACTELYGRRARGEEAPGRGLGATWEGQLITQAIYEGAGRNSKFIPILFDEADAQHIPDFLLPATRFNVSSPTGYEALYRLLTAQPAVLRRALGTIRRMRPEEVSAGAAPMDALVEAGRSFLERSGPTIVWRLPRGFVLLDDLEPESHPSWATIASYYDYAGEWVQSTHPSVNRTDGGKTHGGIDRQCAKLGIPRGDWIFAHAPIDVMRRIREGDIVARGPRRGASAA
jgi:hypothetical protein